MLKVRFIIDKLHTSYYAPIKKLMTFFLEERLTVIHSANAKTLAEIENVANVAKSVIQSTSDLDFFRLLSFVSDELKKVCIIFLKVCFHAIGYAPVPQDT